MPHLSPMMWAISSLMFLIIFITFNSTMWWSQRPIFPSIHVTLSQSSNLPWNWI
uniref:ATP synthase F0 subunit 8 n=1 Tax=Thelepus plagiostoma TaxID=1084972 RepID=A0A8B6QMF1_9ANNE|nr:ATP synthase F0 subunit 8 [Thelepus plagiostoma]QTJ29894.1 ATP synthase F0 subunit 8 [Thelepus plagiostoma]